MNFIAGLGSGSKIRKDRSAPAELSFVASIGEKAQHIPKISYSESFLCTRGLLLPIADAFQVHHTVRTTSSPEPRHLPA